MCPFRVVILSPHRDDAAFSCGLLILALARAGIDTLVANVCTRSDYAPYLDTSEADRTLQVTAERAAEDMHFTGAAAALSGVTDPIRWIDLQWEDAPLRLGIPTRQVLQRAALQSEVFKLALALGNLPQAEILLAPLALGDHMDHRLVRSAAMQAFGHQVILYEDLPYACRMTSTERSASLIASVPPNRRGWSPPAADEAGMKRRLAMCYPSQIAPGVAEEMELYATELGNRERFYGKEAALARLQHALRATV